ncbi:MAG: methyltransferase domain-containing protein [Thermoplasmata archaeon]|nr:methyltransferase domain-containing protein [Thermoplasmata archaeon]
MDDGGHPSTLQVRMPWGWVPLGFVREAQLVYLVARERSARWPVEILRSGVAVLRLPDGESRGRAALVTESSDREQILDRFRATYGPEQYARWYDRPARVLRIALDPPGAAPTRPPNEYAEWLEAEFDNVAEEYDHHITGNRMNRLLRDRSLAQLRATFAGRRHLLEVGCGSGMETLPLLQAGHEVVAVDISERMLAVVRRKARDAGVSERLRTVKLRARDLADLGSVDQLPELDAAYSTYGALNCEPELGPMAEALGRLLRRGSPLILGVYNRWCLFELAGYSLALQGHRALGRRTNPVLVGSSRFCIDVYAYSVSDVDRSFRPWFERRRIEGVPALLPPSDLTSYAERFARRFDRLARWDAALGRRFPFSHLGDHFLATYERRAVPPSGGGA